jgi:hypothetical protein
MRAYCKNNDSTAGAYNSGKTVEALAKRDKGEPIVLYYPAGVWRIDKIPVNTYADPTIFDNVTIEGDFVAPTVQHYEEGTYAGAIRRRTVIEFNGATENDVFWDQQRALRFGEISVRDIYFSSINKGSLFRFGTSAATDNFVTARGLCFDRVYLSRYKHYAGGDAGDGRTWLIDAGANGHVVNQNVNAFGLEMHKCFDVNLNVTVRGFKNCIVNDRCDMPAGKIRGLTAGRVLLEKGPGVGAQWDRVVAENCVLNGAYFTGQVSHFRSETNVANYPPAALPGVYTDMPASITWRVTAGAGYIQFLSFPSTYNCLDYFEPYTYAVFTPTTAGEPPLEVIITTVEADKVYFWASTNKNYVARQLDGIGSGITRYFGSYGIGLDPLFALASRATATNVNGLPDFVIGPHVGMTQMAANSGGRGSDANWDQASTIVGRCAGVQEYIYAGVDFLGTSSKPNHPLESSYAGARDAGPYARRFRYPIWDESTRLLLAVPGRGVSTINDNAKQLTFHPLTEVDGSKVFAYRPKDAASWLNAWYIYGLKKAGVQTKLNLRVYVPSGTPNLQVWAGSGSEVVVPLVTGWQTVYGVTISAANVVADGNGIYVRVRDSAGAGFYVASVVIDQTPNV